MNFGGGNLVYSIFIVVFGLMSVFYFVVGYFSYVGYCFGVGVLVEVLKGFLYILVGWLFLGE